MKFNMGCGFNKLQGFVNIDKFKECAPDIEMDLEKFPWLIESDQADEVVFNHCLEHLGQETSVFLGIVKELYRIAKPDARVVINVPHPRHDHFLGDPTHVRAINPLVLSLFSKKANLYWKEINAANSPLAIYLNVDFEVIETVHVLDPHYQGLLDRKEMTMEELTRYVQERNNVVQEYRFLLRVIK